MIFCAKVNGIDIGGMVPRAARTAALSLKLGDLSGEEKDQDTPVLLLDDVLSGWTAAGRHICWKASTIYRLRSPVQDWMILSAIGSRSTRVFQVVKGHVYMPKGF